MILKEARVLIPTSKNMAHTSLITSYAGHSDLVCLMILKGFHPGHFSHSEHPDRSDTKSGLVFPEIQQFFHLSTFARP